MKILHLLDVSRPNVSGYSSRSDAIIRNLRKLGVETCQLSSQKYGKFKSLEEDIEGINYYRTTGTKGILSKIPLVNYIVHVRDMAKRALEVIELESPDVIHAHSPMLNGLVALQLRNKTGLPIIYEVRAFWEDAAVDTGKNKEWGMKYRLIRAIEQYVFKRVDKISCICEGLKNDIISRGIPIEKIIVAPNAVDLDKFKELSVRNDDLVQKYGLHNKTILAFLGSFFKYEGLEFLLKSLPKIIEEIPNAHVLLVGSGNEESNLKKLVIDLSIQSHVTFTGRVNYEDINKYYSLVDLLVFPRESIRLTQLVTPLKPLEAMALKLPVVASNIGGHIELITHDETGLLFEAENISDLARTVIKVLKDENLRLKLVNNGYDFVKQVRNWENSAKNYLPAYKEITSLNS